ncbi:DegT/DnrJ/EryC1/StrS family aminotransferase [Streptosporangium sp. NPDC001681]|uniref:DegT/DnrJ/EryC1/StrS family aminotransferase n=1 Tax=Streptosporangium sp. NPDC001681 TaxID=3154395 RepID=UPI00332ABC43
MFERLERAMGARLGRPCLYVPSNRFGLFIALCHWMKPGQRLLMSPISADEILFLVLAAGLRPVIAPTCPRSGNIDAASVANLRFDGVLTTNMYGLPDDVVALGKICAEQGIPLIEDAAHAMQTTVANIPVGTHGTAGVFSLSKHAGAAPGGIVALASSDDRPALKELRDRWLTPRYRATEIASLVKMIARNSISGTALAQPAWWLAKAWGLQEQREGHRIALRRNALAPRLAKWLSPHLGLTALDPWIRADNHQFRMRQSKLVESYALGRLKALDRQRERRLNGVRRLAELKTVAQAVRNHLDQPLFRVPLLVDDRDRALDALRRHGIITGYIYDPPFDDYAPGLTEPSPAPEQARWWARHVLPVDPLHVDRAWPVVAALSSGIPPEVWTP